MLEETQRFLGLIPKATCERDLQGRMTGLLDHLREQLSHKTVLVARDTSDGHAPGRQRMDVTFVSDKSSSIKKHTTVWPADVVTFMELKLNCSKNPQDFLVQLHRRVEYISSVQRDRTKLLFLSVDKDGLQLFSASGAGDVKTNPQQWVKTIRIPLVTDGDHTILAEGFEVLVQLLAAPLGVLGYAPPTIPACIAMRSPVCVRTSAPEGTKPAVFFVDDRSNVAKCYPLHARDEYRTEAGFYRALMPLGDRALVPRLITLFDEECVIVTNGAGVDLRAATFNSLWTEDPAQAAVLVRRVVQCVGAALVGIHAAGFVHCDLSLGNVIVCADPLQPLPDGVAVRLNDFNNMGVVDATGVRALANLGGTLPFVSLHYWMHFRTTVGDAYDYTAADDWAAFVMVVLSMCMHCRCGLACYDVFAPPFMRHEAPSDLRDSLRHCLRHASEADHYFPSQFAPALLAIFDEFVFQTSQRTSVEAYTFVSECFQFHPIALI